MSKATICMGELTVTLWRGTCSSVWVPCIVNKQDRYDITPAQTSSVLASRTYPSVSVGSSLTNYPPLYLHVSP